MFFLRLLVLPPVPTSWGSACPSSSSWGIASSTPWLGMRWRRSACRGSSRSTARSAPMSPTPLDSWVSSLVVRVISVAQICCGRFSSVWLEMIHKFCIIGLLCVGYQTVADVEDLTVYKWYRSNDDYLVLIRNEMKLHNQSSKKFWAPSLTLARFWLRVSVSVSGWAPWSRCKNISYSLKCDFETRLYLLSLSFCQDVFSDKSVSSEFTSCQCWTVEDNSCHFHRSFSVRCLFLSSWISNLALKAGCLTGRAFTCSVTLDLWLNVGLGWHG